MGCIHDRHVTCTRCFEESARAVEYVRERSLRSNLRLQAIQQEIQQTGDR